MRSRRLLDSPCSGRLSPSPSRAGAYPAALARATPRRRTAWYRDNIETPVHGRPDQPLPVELPDIRDYVTLLERTFLHETLPPWHSNRLSRLIKTPKLHVGDTGIACALLGPDAATLAKDRTTLGELT